MGILNDGIFWVEWFMLSAVLGGGLYICFADIYNRTVPNVWTVGLMGVGLCGQGIMLINDIITVSQLAGLIAGSVTIAVGMTIARVWGPGDGKLFLGSALALPPTLCPSYNVFSVHAASSALVINVLVCFFIYGLGSMSFGKKNDGFLATGLERAGFYLQSALRCIGLLGIILGMTILVVRRPIGYLEALAALVIGYRLLDFILKARHWSLIVWPGCVVIILLCLTTEGTFAYVGVGIFAWVLEMAYSLLRKVYGRTFTHLVPISDLQPGNVPSRSEFLESQGHVCADRKEVEGMHIKEGQPLTQQDLLRLHQLTWKGVLAPDRQISVDRTIPFVPFITSGALLTAVVADNIGSTISRLLVRLMSYGSTPL